MKKVVSLNFFIIFFILLIGSFSNTFAVEDYLIKISSSQNGWSSSDMMLMIEPVVNVTIDGNVSIQILIGEESEVNGWKDLSSDSDISILKKTYPYIIKNNAKVFVRIVTWKASDKSDLKQLAIKEYQVSNIDKICPIIEKVDSTVSENSIELNISAKDNDSGISKYICKCEETGVDQSSETPKFQFTNLEANKEYTFTITVQDKVGNTIIDTKKIKTKKNVVEAETTGNATEQINDIPESVADTTTANKIIPQIGKSHILLAVILLNLIIIIIKTKDRI